MSEMHIYCKHYISLYGPIPLICAEFRIVGILVYRQVHCIGETSMKICGYLSRGQVNEWEEDSLCCLLAKPCY